MVAIFSALLTIIFTLLWLGNLAFATGLASEDFFLAPICRDISTVSTLVFALLFFFPMVSAISYLQRASREPDAALVQLGRGAYPQNFVFFLVMLGLAGTLYGMFYALSPEDLQLAIEAGGEQATTQAVIDRLLIGLATALLSSLFALLAAFLAASPIRAIIDWASALPDFDADSDAALSATIRTVVGDLRGLSVSARMAQANLGGKASPEAISAQAAQEFPLEQLQALREAHERTNELLSELCAVVGESARRSRHDREALRQGFTYFIQDARPRPQPPIGDDQ